MAIYALEERVRRRNKDRQREEGVKGMRLNASMCQLLAYTIFGQARSSSFSYWCGLVLVFISTPIHTLYTHVYTPLKNTNTCHKHVICDEVLLIVCVHAAGPPVFLCMFCHLMVIRFCGFF